jgi:hypothetical protein
MVELTELFPFFYYFFMSSLWSRPGSEITNYGSATGEKLRIHRYTSTDFFLQGSRAGTSRSSNLIILFSISYRFLHLRQITATESVPVPAHHINVTLPMYRCPNNSLLLLSWCWYRHIIETLSDIPVFSIYYRHRHRWLFIVTLPVPVTAHHRNYTFINQVPVQLLY